MTQSEKEATKVRPPPAARLIRRLRGQGSPRQHPLARAGAAARTWTGRPPRAEPFRLVDGRLLGALLAIVLALVATTVIAERQPVKPVGPVMRDAVPRIPSVRRSTELGPIKQLSRVTARDNGQSTRYGQESIWVFADTVLGKPWGFLSNSGAATTDLDASDGLTLTASDVAGHTDSQPAALIPLTAPERAFEAAHATGQCMALTDTYCGARFAFWPGPVIADPARHRVLIFYNKLCRGGADGTFCSGQLGKGLGTGVAALDMLTHRVTRLTARHAQPVLSVEGVDPTMFFPPSPGYAAAALTVGGDAYVYGDCVTGCHLARVSLRDIADRSTWRFYAGRDRHRIAIWSPRATHAVDAIAAGAAGNTVLWNPALRGWLNFYLPYGTNELTAQIGGSPYGPWSPPFSLLTTDTGGTGTNYAAFAHPEYAEEDGLVEYVSYYQTSSGNQRLVQLTFGR